MAYQYYYFISSLLGLQLDGDVPWSIDAFMDYARYHLDPIDWEKLGQVKLVPSLDDVPVCELHQRWINLEIQIRNLMVRVRASRQHRDGLPFLLPENDLLGGIDAIVQEVGSLHPLAGEMLLDRWRWRFIDLWVVGHEFDFNAIVAYRLKLLLLEKRKGIEREKGYQQLEQFKREKLTTEKLPEFIHG